MENNKLNLLTNIPINLGFQTTRVAEEVIMAPATRRLNANLKVEKVTGRAHRDSVYAVHVSYVACLKIL